MDNKLIGERIKQAREENKLTLKEVADRIGVNKSTIQRYEAGNIGNIKLPVIESIAKALNVNPAWIAGKEEHRAVKIRPYSKNIMGKPLDLIGMQFERLTVVKKTNRRNKSGQVYWECICNCGNTVETTGASLKNGDTKSCGCLQKESTQNRIKNKKVCVICSKEFECPPSDKTITCSVECSKKQKSLSHMGRKILWTNERKFKVSQKGQTDNLKKGTDAALKSPNSGRFETNVNAKHWVLISPEGIEIQCTNLKNWIRENYELFGEYDVSDKEIIVNRIHRGLCTAWQNKNKNRNCQTYKDWYVKNVEQINKNPNGT